MIVGLRVDVDTLRGTQRGVPALNDLLARRDIRASYFFSVGPDNMGRHVWRLARPEFLAKMLRTGAPSLYGWDILLRGTFWPGPLIGRRCADVIRDTAARGHEVGLHAWDHHAWQAHLGSWSRPRIHAELARGVECLTAILGEEPTCSATPAWRCTPDVLEEKALFPFDFNSDCRGTAVFMPVVEGRALMQPQVPTTLPTFDEVFGRDGIDDSTYNAHILRLLKPDGLNVLTIHAEAEGISRLALFDDFIDRAEAAGAHFVPLSELIPTAVPIEPGAIEQRSVEGREGSSAWQVRTAAASSVTAR